MQSLRIMVEEENWRNKPTRIFLFLILKIYKIWLQSKADAFEYADQVLERWYPTLEEGSNKGILVLVTSQKEGAVTGGPAFVEAVGENILDATVTENLPGKYSFIFFVTETEVENLLIFFSPVLGNFEDDDYLQSVNKV